MVLFGQMVLLDLDSFASFSAALAAERALAQVQDVSRFSSAPLVTCLAAHVLAVFLEHVPADVLEKKVGLVAHSDVPLNVSVIDPVADLVAVLCCIAVFVA